MTRFHKTAALASVLSVALGGAAFAQSELKQGQYNGTLDPSLTVDTATGKPTRVVGASPDGSGPMAGWPVYGSDGAQVGTLINSVFDNDNHLKYIIFVMANGNQVQMPADAVARSGKDSLSITVPAQKVQMAATAPVTALSVTNPLPDPGTEKVIDLSNRGEGYK